MREQWAGIIVEIVSTKKCVGKFAEDKKEIWIDGKEGHITHCIVLPKGRAYDNMVGLKFQIDAKKGDDVKNVFYVPWEKILEVRNMEGGSIYRNWYLCPQCRRITKFFLSNSGPFCRYCECKISQEANRKACILPLAEVSCREF